MDHLESCLATERQRDLLRGVEAAQAATPWSRRDRNQRDPIGHERRHDGGDRSCRGDPATELQRVEKDGGMNKEEKIAAIQKGLEEAERKGFIERDFARVKPTERGFDFLNDLQSLFLAD